jgi:hypothetical protein
VFEGVRAGAPGLETRKSAFVLVAVSENDRSMFCGPPLPPLGRGPYEFQDDSPDENPVEGVYAEMVDVGVYVTVPSGASYGPAGYV